MTLAELEAELAGDVEEEPSWELPAELQQYRLVIAHGVLNM